MKRIIATILCILFVSGCASTRPFSSSLPKNLNIHTRTESGSVFSSLNAYVDIYNLDANCQLSYDGTVELGQEKIQVGLPKNTPSYLIFRFESSGFLGSTSGSTQYTTLLRPLKGRRYEVEVNYIDNLYNVEIMQVRGGKRKIIENLPLDACKKLVTENS